MKASNLYFALGAAQLAVCAPVPNSSTWGIEKEVHAEHEVATPPREWSSQYHQDNARRPDRHDSSTLFLSKTPSPAGDGLLPPLSRHRIPRPGNQRVQTIEVVHIPTQPAEDESDGSDFVFVDGTLRRLPGIPYPQDVSLADRNNMHVVFMVMAFLVGVVAMETWKSLSKRQGAIRLDEPARQPALSIRATPDDHDGIRNEKDDM